MSKQSDCVLCSWHYAHICIHTNVNTFCQWLAPGPPRAKAGPREFFFPGPLSMDLVPPYGLFYPGGGRVGPIRAHASKLGWTRHTHASTTLSSPQPPAAPGHALPLCYLQVVAAWQPQQWLSFNHLCCWHTHTLSCSYLSQVSCMSVHPSVRPPPLLSLSTAPRPAAVLY